MPYRPPAKLSAELFFGAKVFADHFLRLYGNSWEADPDGWAVASEDSVKLTVSPYQTTQYYKVNFPPFNLSTAKYLVWRLTGKVGISAAKVWVQRTDNKQWVEVSSESEVGRYVVDASAVYSGSIEGIMVSVDGTSGTTGTFDYVVLCEDYKIWDYTDDHSPITDIVGVTDVMKTLINDEVSSANFTVKDFATDYVGLTEYGYGVIWAARDVADLGKLDFKLFSGRLVLITQDYLQYSNTDVTFTLHGHASELVDSPELVYKRHEGENGRVVLEETLNVCQYLHRFPHAVGWFDVGGQIGDYNDGIYTNHDLESDEIQPLRIFQEILDKAGGAYGNVGFDCYERGGGVLVGHARYSPDWICPIEPTLRSAVRKVDFNRIVNKQKVYGAIGRKYPEDYAWTESTDGWIADVGTITTAAEAIMKLPGLPDVGYPPKAGSVWLKLELDGGDGQIRRNISDIPIEFGKRRFTQLHFWRSITLQNIWGSRVAKVELLAPDNSNKFAWDLRINPGSSGSRFFELPLGEDFTARATGDDVDDPTGKWEVVGNPKWGDLEYLQFRFDTVRFRDAIFFDDMAFSGALFFAEAKDETSIAKFGAREGEPINDQTLMSDAECLSRATARIHELKNPIITVEPFDVAGHLAYQPGDLITDGVNNFRIISIHHRISTSEWRATITVSEAL